MRVDCSFSLFLRYLFFCGLFLVNRVCSTFVLCCQWATGAARYKITCRIVSFAVDVSLEYSRWRVAGMVKMPLVTESVRGGGEG